MTFYIKVINSLNKVEPNYKLFSDLLSLPKVRHILTWVTNDKQFQICIFHFYKLGQKLEQFIGLLVIFNCTRTLLLPLGNCPFYYDHLKFPWPIKSAMTRNLIKLNVLQWKKKDKIWKSGSEGSQLLGAFYDSRSWLAGDEFKHSNASFSSIQPYEEKNYSPGAALSFVLTNMLSSTSFQPNEPYPCPRWWNRLLPIHWTFPTRPIANDYLIYHFNRECRRQVLLDGMWGPGEKIHPGAQK